MSELGLYIHIPFCLSKCPYCDFYSVKYDEIQAEEYCKAVIRAMENSPANGRRVDSVYFGGGTPVLMGERLNRILDAAAKHYSLAQDSEITLEANPAAMTLQTMRSLKSGGFNRVSMGVQSSSDKELSCLGRRHSFSQAIDSVNICKEAGFGNISVDIMLGTPGQTAASIDRFVETFDELDVQHISGYLLKIEPGTPFAKQQVQRLCPDEEKSADLYLHTIEKMSRHGFAQYEVSNFARTGFESRHNLKYWRCEEYLGIGPAAHSFMDGKRFLFPRDVKAFVEKTNVWEIAEQDGEGGDLFDYMMLRLRLTEGINMGELRRRFGEETKPIADRAKFLRQHGLVSFDGEKLALTPQGFLVSNSVIVDLLSYM